MGQYCIEFSENMNINLNDALIVVDLQNDFIPGGTLAVPQGEEILNGINSLMSQFYKKGNLIVLTQDWHPEGHLSFASSHEGKVPFNPIKGISGIGPVVWPDHCVQGTSGAKFHSSLNTDLAHLIIRKGFRKEIDSYSTFMENDQKTSTGLAGYLQSFGIKKIFVCGLALDFCVFYSAIDAKNLGFEVVVVFDLTRGIAKDSIDKGIKIMQENKIDFVKSESII